MLHAVDAGEESKMRTGMRVRVRWRDETVGEILDIALRGGFLQIHANTVTLVTDHAAIVEEGLDAARAMAAKPSSSRKVCPDSMNAGR